MNTLSSRKTWKYVTAWSHLDEWKNIGCYEIAKSRRKPIEDGMREIQIISFTPEENVTDKEIKKAIIDTIQFGCTHEHDCCGCLNGGAYNARKLTNKLWAVRISAYRNL